MRKGKEKDPEYRITFTEKYLTFSLTASPFDKWFALWESRWLKIRDLQYLSLYFFSVMWGRKQNRKQAKKVNLLRGEFCK